MDLRKHIPAIVALLSILICLAVYFRALSCGFVNWEDQDYVINNVAIRSLDSDFLKWAFTTMPLCFWLPATWVSFALDYHFWQLEPLGYHLTNILLHAANSGLTVLIADKLLRDKLSGIELFSSNKYLYPLLLLFSGLLFGIHPARVESVAWVTERKDVLNGFFTFSSILFYLKYINKKDDANNHISWIPEYLLSLFLFLLSLMSKPTSVVLPVMLLIMDWYPLKRWNSGYKWQVLLEKTPYFLFSAGITIATFMSNAQQGGLNPFSEFPLNMRLIASGNSIAEYFQLMLYPVGILPYYNLPKSMPQIFVVKAVAVAVIICYLFFIWQKRPLLTATLLFFIVPLLPVLQLTANGAQLILASRYTYLPSLLPSILTVIPIAAAYSKSKDYLARYGVPTVTGLLISLLVFYGIMTYSLIGVWQNSGTMWSRVIAHQPFERAYFYRGLYYVDNGNYQAAIEDYTTCLGIAAAEQIPDIFNLYAFRGEALVKAGRFQDAITDLTTAITILPHNLYFYHRGLAFKGLGKIREAEEDFSRAGRANGQMYWFGK